MTNQNSHKQVFENWIRVGELSGQIRSVSLRKPTEGNATFAEQKAAINAVVAGLAREPQGSRI